MILEQVCSKDHSFIVPIVTLAVIQLQLVDERTLSRVAIAKILVTIQGIQFKY